MVEDLGAMGTPQKWTSTEEPPLSLVRRTWRRLVKRTIRIFYIQGDTLSQVSKRIAGFVVGWGCFIGLLTWAGYRNGYLHGVDGGILSVCILFALALLTAPGYLVLDTSEMGNPCCPELPLVPAYWGTLADNVNNEDGIQSPNPQRATPESQRNRSRLPTSAHLSCGVKLPNIWTMERQRLVLSSGK